MRLNPYIKASGNTTPIIMFDVIIALLPVIVISVVAFGTMAILLIGTSVLSAILTDMIFSGLLLKNRKAVFDGSSIVTALLLTFTVSPLTPWYVLAVGSSLAVLFGKILWGGLGKNRFNPALVGREIMTVIFPAIIGASGIWVTSSYVNVPSANFFPGLESSYISALIYKTSGAMGEYSSLFIVLGGLYLLIRKRISWHIPVAVILVFHLCFWLMNDLTEIRYSIAGLLFGTMFMATDMPSSPDNKVGKLYYGAMIGLVTFLLILGGVRFEYLSYSILILNGFSSRITETFIPRVWGTKNNKYKKIENVFLLTLSILGVTLAVLSLHNLGLQAILLFAFVAFLLFKFIFSSQIVDSYKTDRII